jgi:type I restriction enzyme S subunit
VITAQPSGGPWPTSTVGAHFDVQLGKMLDAARNVGDRKAYLGNRAIKWGRIDLSAAGLVPLTREDRVRYRLRANDLIVCEGGEVGRAAIWRDELAECYYQKALHRLRSKTDFDPRVMMALLEYWSEIRAFDTFVTQTSIAHLPRASFLTMPLPVIPSCEQARIAEALDDVNSLIIALESRIEKGNAIKQGMMQQLLTGKTRLPGFEGVWKERSMGSLGTTYGGLFGKTGDDFGVGSGRYIPFMAVMADVLVTERSLMMVQVDKRERQNTVRTDDLIFNTSSETPDELAMCAAVGDMPADTYLNSFCFGFRLTASDVADPLFLAYTFRSGVGRQLMRALAQGVIRYNLSRSHFRNVMVTLPPVDEQRAIAQVLDDAASGIGVLRDRLAKAKAIKRGMMQELVTGRTRLRAEEAVTA